MNHFSFASSRHQTTMVASKGKESDVTVYGATGMTGKYISRYLMDVANKHGKSLSITLAGRNPSKLESRKEMLLSEQGEANSKDTTLDVFVADSKDIEKLTEMAKRTSVVICCAGPFERYASGVVQACATTGTDYVDITAEVEWVAKMRQQWGPAAAKSGARIISFCGFDSIPSDLAVLGAVQAFRKTRGDNVELTQGSTWHVIMGGANGGTLLTAANMPMDIQRMVLHHPEKTLRKVPLFVFDPLVLTHPTQVRHNPDFQSRRDELAFAEWYNQLPSLERMLGWSVSIPFFMGVANSKVVHASAIACDYGPKFVYYERNFPLGWSLSGYLGILTLIPALMAQLSILFVLSVMRIPVLGSWLLQTLVPPGSGLPDSVNARGYAQVYAEVTAPAAAPTNPSHVDRATCFMAFEGDPGNLVTAQCVCESALALLWHRDDLPPKSTDGFGTPAQLLGPVLLQRLKDTQVRPVEFFTKFRKDDTPRARKISLYA